MAGTGQGALQPTKLIQADDFMPSIAPPGYIQRDAVTVASANTYQFGFPGTSVAWIVPDGMTVEVVDFGVTATDTLITETKGATCTDISLIATTSGAAVTVVDACGITGLGGESGTLAVAATASIGRGSIPSGAGTGTIDEGYVFTPASIALGNKFGPNTKFEFVLADVAGGVGTGATGVATVFIRLKWSSKDSGAV